jgi:hypothetical protein
MPYLSPRMMPRNPKYLSAAQNRQRSIAVYLSRMRGLGQNDGTDSGGPPQTMDLSLPAPLYVPPDYANQPAPTIDTGGAPTIPNTGSILSLGPSLIAAGPPPPGSPGVLATPAPSAGGSIISAIDSLFAASPQNPQGQNILTSTGAPPSSSSLLLVAGLGIAAALVLGGKGKRR